MILTQTLWLFLAIKNNLKYKSSFYRSRSCFLYFDYSIRMNMEAIMCLLMKKTSEYSDVFFIILTIACISVYIHLQSAPSYCRLLKHALLVLASLLCFRIRLVHVEQHTPYHHCYSFER